MSNTSWKGFLISKKEETIPQPYFFLIIKPIDHYTCIPLGDAKIFAAKYVAQLTGYIRNCTLKSKLPIFVLFSKMFHLERASFTLVLSTYAQLCTQTVIIHF